MGMCIGGCHWEVGGEHGEGNVSGGLKAGLT